MTRRKTFLAGLLAGATLLLAACGGGGGGTAAEPEVPAAVTVVPASAGDSVQSMLTYLGSMAATDQRDALGTDQVTALPTSDTTEPMALE